MRKPKGDPLERHFEELHNNPPAPFNPSYDPAAVQRATDECNSIHELMYKEGIPYEGATEQAKEEYRAEFRRRLAELRASRKA